jgi:hypothetical protein
LWVIENAHIINAGALEGQLLQFIQASPVGV